MITAILIINNHGKPRLTKFYNYFVRISPFLSLSCFNLFCFFENALSCM